jgi:hypothetical protein
MSEWIPIKIRPINEEEKTFYMIEEGDIITGRLPENGEEVLITAGDAVYADTYYNNEEDGAYFELSDINEVDAWMPLPKPYNKNTNPHIRLLAMAAQVCETFGDVYLKLKRRSEKEPGCQIAIDECVEMIENALKEAENAWRTK